MWGTDPRFYNEAGEPLMSAEQMTAEMRADAEPYWCPDCHTTHPFALDQRHCDTGCYECGDHAPLYLYCGSERVCRNCYIFDQGDGFEMSSIEGGGIRIEDCRNDFREVARCYGGIAEAIEVAFLLAVGRRHRRDDVVTL